MNKHTQFTISHHQNVSGHFRIVWPFETYTLCLFAYKNNIRDYYWFYNVHTYYNVNLYPTYDVDQSTTTVNICGIVPWLGKYQYTVDLEMFVLTNFCMINFHV